VDSSFDIPSIMGIKNIANVINIMPRFTSDDFASVAMTASRGVFNFLAKT